MQHFGKNSKQRVVNYLAGVCGCAQVIVHNASKVNVVRGIVERVLRVRRNGRLVMPPKPIINVFNDRLHGLRVRLLSNLSPTTVVPLRNFADLYDGRKKRRYEEACNSLARSGMRKADAVVNTFVKAEKVILKPGKEDPAPRVIQPRSYRFNAGVGRYLKLFEKELFAGLKRFAGYTVVHKGMNAEELAKSMRELWSEFSDPVAIGLDASRFDQHVSKEALLFEHSIYNSVFQSEELARWLSWQLVNKGRAFVDGEKLMYTVEGCRMSGDINTSMGNCLIMSSIVLGFIQHVGIKARLVNNGDDCVVIVERGEMHLLNSIDQWFIDFGFTLTKEEPVDVFEQIEFCQMNPVCVNGTWRMVRNPFTAVTKDCTSLLTWRTEVEFNNWSKSIGTAGLSLTGGVPIWQAFHTRLFEVDGKVTYRFEDEGVGRFGCNSEVAEVSDETRVSFWRAFGVLPDMQIQIESEMQGVSYSKPMMLTGIDQGQVFKYAATCRTARRNISNSGKKPKT